jgi:hypothetical protein
MPYRDPGNFNLFHWLYEYATTLFIAIWGGAVSYLRRVRTAKRDFSLSELVGEVFISAFAGLLAYWGCLELKVSPTLTAITVGIAGHAGASTIFYVESFFRSKAGLPPMSNKDKKNN